jgi:hypothetical protein
MKITVLKTTVETALAPILKMVSATKLSADLRPKLTFQSDKQSLSIGCTLPEKQLFVALADAVFDEKNASFDVNLEMFQRMTAAVKGNRLSIEQDAAHVVLNCDERFIGQLVPMTSMSDAKFQIPKDADTTVLPTSFPNFLLQAFSCASAERDRPLLTGVNVSSRGIAATDGKQLFHLPLPLQLKEEVTLPPSRCYAALKSLRWTALSRWRTPSGEAMFAVVGDGFRYAAKAIVGCYPRYWQLLLTTEGNDVRFTLTPEGAQRLREHLGSGSRGFFARLTVHPDRIELLDFADLSRRSVFAASSDSTGLPCAVKLDTCYLRQFLKMGFLTMSLSSKSQNPLASSEGTGVYLFMPCGEREENDDKATAEATSPSTQTESQTNCHEGNCTQTNNQPKEKPTMTQAISPTTAPVASTIHPVAPVARPVPTTAPQTQSAQNPLDETLACIAAMREQLSALEARLLDAGRGIKAALIEQRQRERLYADAKRKLERVRLAV